MQLKTPHKPTCCTIVLIAFLIVGLVPMVASATSVTGSYLKASGNTIIFELMVGKPAPSSIIVEQSLSKKNVVQSVSPKPKKISSSGQVKWLVTNIKPGKKKFTIHLSAPLKGSVHTVLRYRNPSNGQFIEKNITP